MGLISTRSVLSAEHPAATSTSIDRTPSELQLYLEPLADALRMEAGEIRISGQARWEHGNVRTLRQLFEAVRHSCARICAQWDLPGVIAVPRGMMINTLRSSVSRNARLR